MTSAPWHGGWARVAATAVLGLAAVVAFASPPGPPAAPVSTPSDTGKEEGKDKNASETAPASDEDKQQRKLKRQQRMDRFKRLGSLG
ncbi:MAG: hypothetical protein ACT4NV_13850 [Rhodoferax sp.]